MKWWDWIQATFKNLLYFILLCQQTLVKLLTYFMNSSFKIRFSIYLEIPRCPVWCLASPINLSSRRSLATLFMPEMPLWLDDRNFKTLSKNLEAFFSKCEIWFTVPINQRPVIFKRIWPKRQRNFFKDPHEDNSCQLKSIHFKKSVTRSSFLSKSVVIFVIVILKMTTLFERNEDRVTGFLKWTDFRYIYFFTERDGCRLESLNRKTVS